MSGPFNGPGPGPGTQDAPQHAAPTAPGTGLSFTTAEASQQTAARPHAVPLGAFGNAGEAAAQQRAAATFQAQQAAFQQQQQLLAMQAYVQQQQQQQQQAAETAAAALQQQALLNAVAASGGAAAAGGLNPQHLQMLQAIQRNQQMLNQQQAAQAAQLAGYLTPQQQYVQYQQLVAAAAARGAGGDVPPAKRQAIAIDPTLQAQQAAQAAAAQHFRALHAAGKLSNMSVGQQQIAYLQVLNACRLRFGLPEQHGSYSAAAAAAAGRANMRVAIDKRNKAAGDRMFHAEDTTGRDHADEVMSRCEEISRALASHLGKSGEEGEVALIEQQQMIEACGNTARFLKPYQIAGVNFLTLLYRTKVGGAILADEMGLGKTAQLITYLGCIKTLQNDPGPHLVVVPASLLENWQRELRRWCPALKSVVYYGKHRMVVRKRLNELRERMLAGEEVDDDLADLEDPEVLAEAAASERRAEAAALDNGEAGEDDDPLGLEAMNESDDEFDVRRANDPETAFGGSGAGGAPRPEPPPPVWDYNATLPPAPFNVMLTSYTLFERDSPDQRVDREFLESWKWSHLIMDEAHALKNRSAQRTTRLRRVANLSRRRIMMTGTPLQNDLEELHNLMHFLLPNVFQSQGFDSMEAMLQGDETQLARLTERMRRLLEPFVLRRQKTEVAGQLTAKKHLTEFIAMTPMQQEMYDAALNSYKSALDSRAAAAVASNGADAVDRFVKTVGAKKINHMFTHLRKIAQHPLLVRHHYDDAKVTEIAGKAFDLALFGGNATLRRVTDELMNYSDYSLHAFCYNAGPAFVPYRLNATHLMTSAKFQRLAELLPRLREAGSRPLIFSQWTAVLDVIEWLMDELRLPYVRLDGSTAVDERLATVDRFNTSDDVFAFLLSTRAGGQGLNLTGADTVILHDVDFNPQIDRQAEDRCHRLGQTKPVSVYRLITKASVDQNIYDLSQRKLRLDHAVLDGIVKRSGGGGRGEAQRAAAQERAIASNILQSVFAGKVDYEAMEAAAAPPAGEADGDADGDGDGAAAAAEVKMEQNGGVDAGDGVPVKEEIKQDVKQEKEEPSSAAVVEPEAVPVPVPAEVVKAEAPEANGDASPPEQPAAPAAAPVAPVVDVPAPAAVPVAVPEVAAEPAPEPRPAAAPLSHKFKLTPTPAAPVLEPEPAPAPAPAEDGTAPPQ